VTLDGTGQSILGSTTFYNLTKSVAAADTLTFQAGQTTTINGTVTLNGATGNLLSLRSDSPGTRWNFNVSAGATKAIDYVDVQDSDASGSDPSQLPIRPTNSVDSGNNDRWFEKIISGTVYTDEGVTNAGAGLTVRLIVNGVDVGSDVTDAAGAYSILATLLAGDALLVYLDAEAIDATTVTVSDGADLSGLDIYADHVITRHDNGGILSNADMDTAKGAFSDAEIEYSITAGALTVPSPNELYVPTGYTFAPGADVTTYGVKIVGTMNGGADTITVQADWLASGGTFNAGTSSVEFTSNNATFTAGASAYYDVTIDLNPGQTLTLGSSLDVDHDLTITAETLDVSASNYAITVGGNFTNLDTFTARNGTVTLDGTGQSILGSTTFYNLTKSVAAADTLTFQAGQTTTINGTVTLNGATGNLLSLRSDSPGTRWNFNVSAGATKAIDYVDVQDSDASGSDPSQKRIYPTNSVSSGNNVDWFDTTISGTVYTDEGVTNAGAGLTVRLIVNGVDSGSDVTDAAGAYSIAATLLAGDALLVYVDAGAIDATTVTVSDGADFLSGLDIYADHVITRHDNGGTLSNADMDTAQGSYVDDEIEYSVTGGVLTVPSPNELYVPTGHTFFPNGDVNTYTVEILGTMNLDTSTISVANDWTAASGTITGPAGSGTVLFTSGSATFIPGPSSYPKVTVSLSPGSTLTLGGALDVDNNLRIDSGTLDVSVSNYDITLGGNFRNVSTFTARNGTVTFDGTGQSILGSTTFYNFTKSVAVADTFTFLATDTTTINGTVTLNGAAGNLLSLRSDTPGTRWNFIVTAGATKVIDYVDVQDSDASGSDASHRPIGPTNSVDSGNTIDWFFVCPGGVVTTTVDSTTGGSLRACIIWANGNPGADTLAVPAGTYILSIAGTGEDAAATGDLDITEDIVINGNAVSATIVDANAIDRVFHILNVSATFSNLTIRDGNVGGNGGGISLNADASLTLSSSTLSGNTATAQGGGIHNIGVGAIELTNVTLNGNTAAQGGGISCNGACTITNVTITANTGTLDGGGFRLGAATASATFLNTIMANNGAEDCSVLPPATIVSNGYNLSSDATCNFTNIGDLENTDPLLGPLQDNGGPTFTHELLTGSPAIDAGTNIGCPATDQRGFARPSGASCDIGAYETGIVSLALTKTAFLPDGTPIPTGSILPGFQEFKYLLYINNKDVAKIDVSVRDVLDPVFQYQLGTIQVDNSVAECALNVCTAAEELAIFTAVDGAAFLSDAVDGDVASYTVGSLSVDAGNSTEANLQLDINANAVWAILFSVKMP